MNNQGLPLMRGGEYVDGSFDDISIPTEKIPYRFSALRCCGLFDDCGWPQFFPEPSPKRENISILNHFEEALPTTKKHLD